MTYQLKHIKIEKFKKLSDFEFDLADINILVGSNGSGKSSVLQGVHLACCAFRQAPEVGSRTRVILTEELDYLPTEILAELGNETPWGNMESSPSSKITLAFKHESESTDITAWEELRVARNNAGISVKGNIPLPLRDKLRRNIFSAYIPGISGIPNKEVKASKRVVQRACSFGDSNSYLRNILLRISQDGKIPLLEEWINNVIIPNQIRIEISHDEEKDLNLNCFVSINSRKQPIELVGTGYLQLIQIFAYILFLNPGLVLIDEPDNHLHPPIQEKLLPVLAQIAQERKLKIILATHSPYIVRGAPLNAKTIWLREGQILSDNREALELSLGWGIMGKKLLFFSEDKEISFLKKIISQWPELERQIAIHPGNGYQNLITPEQASQVKSTLHNSIKILIHRDRDALTDAEIEILKKRYRDAEVTLWIPPDSDIESYFCNTNIIAEITCADTTTAQGYLDTAISRKTNETKDKFASHRKAHNKELWPEGGSPTNDNVWQEMQGKPLKGAYGKGIFSELKNQIPHNAFRENIIWDTNFSVEIASDLKSILEDLLSASRS